MISNRCKCWVLGLGLAGIRVASAADGLTSAECQVWERERSFAESVAKHDRVAFIEHVDEGAVFGAASPKPQRGRDAIVQAWAGIIEGKGVTIEWRPNFVSIAADPHVAMSRGPFVIVSWDATGARKYAIGEFVSIWTRKDASSPWHVLLDGGGPPPSAATEAEAKRHLETAPASCPRAPWLSRW
jgi:ketosteroid isomerase-like protein